jgi:transcriptional regulator with XRE-family HTH domain
MMSSEKSYELSFLLDSDKIRNLRSKTRLTQGEIAEKVGLKSVTYSSYEQASRMVPVEVLRKLAKVFNVQESELVLKSAGSHFFNPESEDARLVRSLDSDSKALRENLSPEDINKIIKAMKESLKQWLSLDEEVADGQILPLDLHVKELFWYQYSAMLIYFELYPYEVARFLPEITTRYYHTSEFPYEIEEEYEEALARMWESSNKEISLAYHMMCWVKNPIEYITDPFSLFSQQFNRDEVKYDKDFFFLPTKALLKQLDLESGTL